MTFHYIPRNHKTVNCKTTIGSRPWSSNIVRAYLKWSIVTAMESRTSASMVSSCGRGGGKNVKNSCAKARIYDM